MRSRDRLAIMLAAFSLIYCSDASAEPPDLNTYIVQSRADRSAELTRRLSQLAEAHKKTPGIKDSILEDRIAYLRDPTKPYFGIDSFNWDQPKIGQMGRVERRLIEVRRILTPTSAIADFPLYEPSDSIDPRLMNGKFFSERGSATGVGDSSPRPQFIIDNIDTHGWIDNESRLVSGVFAFTGTRMLVGSTYMTISFVDLAKKSDQFTRSLEARKWKPKGAAAIDAVFVKYEHGKATIETMAGATFEYGLSELSDEDGDFVRQQIREATTKPIPTRQRRRGTK